MTGKDVHEAKAILRKWITRAGATPEKRKFVEDCRKVLSVLDELTPGVK